MKDGPTRRLPFFKTRRLTIGFRNVSSRQIKKNNQYSCHRKNDNCITVKPVIFLSFFQYILQ